MPEIFECRVQYKIRPGAHLLSGVVPVDPTVDTGRRPEKWSRRPVLLEIGVKPQIMVAGWTHIVKAHVVNVVTGRCRLGDHPPLVSALSLAEGHPTQKSVLVFLLRLFPAFFLVG